MLWLWVRQAQSAERIGKNVMQTTKTFMVLWLQIIEISAKAEFNICENFSALSMIQQCLV